MDEIKDVRKYDVEPGDFLVAMTSMDDPDFKESIVLICHANEDGHYGLVINKEFDLPGSTIGALPRDWPKSNYPVCWGGPVGRDHVQVVHTDVELKVGTTPICEGLVFGGDIEFLRYSDAQGDNLRIFIGYTGWEPGQLEEEIRLEKWLCAPRDSKVLFNKYYKTLWESLIDFYFPGNDRWFDASMN